MITSHEITRDEIVNTIKGSFLPKKVKVEFHIECIDGSSVHDEKKLNLKGATVTEIEEDKK